MRIFNPNQMVVALRQEAVGRGEFISYALIELATIPSYFLNGQTDFSTLSTFYGYIMVVILTTIIGLLTAYRANNSGDGKHFWYRYFSLSLPIGLLMLGISVSVVLIEVAFIALFISRSEPYFLINNVDIALMSILSLFYFYLIYKYMRKVSRP